MKIGVVRYTTMLETQHRLFEPPLVFAMFALWHG